jgi:hypothetical protein
MTMRHDRLGLPVTIADEYVCFETSMLTDGNPRPSLDYLDLKHAFYMGALMMLHACHGANAADLKCLAGEFDDYLSEHAECCAECRRAMQSRSWRTTVSHFEDKADG